MERREEDKEMVSLSQSDYNDGERNKNEIVRFHAVGSQFSTKLELSTARART